MRGGRGGPVGWVRSRLRSALWPIPTLAVLVAVGLGIYLPDLDAALDGPDGHPLVFAFGGGPSAARDLLAAIAGSLISVTGLVFSLTVVTLQLASSQYSPRLLQTFVTDRVVQVSLAQLSATFVYALTVLRTVRTESASQTDSAFVPRLAITIAYLLALGSVLALVLFLGHLARSLRVETMLRDVHDEAGAVLAREFPAGEITADDTSREEDARLPPGRPELVCSRANGFVTDVDEPRLVAAAARAGAVVVLTVRIGDAVVTGVPVAHVWRHGAGDDGVPDDSATDTSATDTSATDLTGPVNDAIRLEFERSTGRDVAYSLRKVVDIAVRALSPGVNDPTTAVHALSHVSAMLGDLLACPLGPRRLTDDEDTVRLVVPQWSPQALIALALEEPLQFADGQPSVLRRIAALLRELAWRAPREMVEDAVRMRTGLVVAAAQRSTALTEEELEGWRRRIDDAFAGRWEPEPPGKAAAAPPGGNAT